MEYQKKLNSNPEKTQKNLLQSKKIHFQLSKSVFGKGKMTERRYSNKRRNYLSIMNQCAFLESQTSTLPFSYEKGQAHALESFSYQRLICTDYFSNI